MVDIAEGQVEKDGAFYVYRETHRVYYSTEKPVPIKEVIIALQGLEGLLKPVPAILSTLTGVEIEGGEFLIQSLESGSLIEDIVVKFLFKDKANLDAFVEKLGANKMTRGLVIGAVVAGLAGYGLYLAMGQKPAPAIQATNSVIIQNGAGTLNISPEAFDAALKATVGSNKKAIAESALKMTSPVRADPASSVSFGAPDATVPAATIPHAAVAEAPRRIELAANERVEEQTGATLTIRAADLDSKKRGWAGRLDAREERLPIELDPAVSESEIFGRTTVRVDAALIFREKGKSRELKPARIYVRKVYPPKG